MTPQEFIAKWQIATLTERSACQQHFLDLCDVLGQPKPAAADPDGAWYTFERGVNKTEGGHGWADVWRKDHFGWEYKGKRKDLNAAYQQLLLYRESLGNPPLLVVCDLDRFEIHTNFTRTVKTVYAFDLASLAEPDNINVLRSLFDNPDALKPGETTASITERAAKEFAELAEGMWNRGIEPHRAAHFLMKLMFCMFAEDIRLLPDKLFTKIVLGTKNDPQRLGSMLSSLFQAMCTGGMFGADEILHFNGGLFKDADVVELTPHELRILCKVNEDDWSNVEPSIFGTLFERTLDPAKRSQIGAHYTSRDDIETLLKPVMLAPLRREWDEVRAKCEKQWEKVAAQLPAPAKLGAKRSRKAKTPKKAVGPKAKHERLLLDFVERLAHVKVLDPACGSGNFLYVAIHLLLDLEKEVVSYAATRQLGLLPQVRPTQLAGIEINPYAQELAQVVIWIGFLQWMHHNGFQPPRNPVLEPFESIVNKDAIIDLSDPENPKESEWPVADFIVGNPPFLGDKLMRNALGDDYVDRLRTLYVGRVPGGADLCCYWFEMARTAIESNLAKRAGLLATQGIRGGQNREVLLRIKRSGDIYFAESDRPWILEGANVHVSMVGFDDGSQTDRQLDKANVATINANLTEAADTTTVKRILANRGIAYIGNTKKAPFDIGCVRALELLRQTTPHGKPNSDVLFPYTNGLSVTRRPVDVWIIDFAEMEMDTASLYEGVFELVKETVYPLRVNHREPRQKEKWWLLARSCPEMQQTVRSLSRFIVTPTVCKHRVFAWLQAPTSADHQLYVFARDDDYCFGVLHSRVHEIWSLKLGTRLETRPRYTPTTCFETFPFPDPGDTQQESIAEAAKELDGLRNRWLNPPEWTREEVLEFPGSVDGPWSRYVVEPDEHGIGTVHYPRTVPKDDDCAKRLKKRTLTNLYNERPTWLDLAHRKLDAAVFAAYGWEPSISDDELLAKLLALNLERSRPD